LRLAIADPPYPGQSAKHYSDHPDYAGEVDHEELVGRLKAYYDGWVLHTSSVALRDILPLCPPDARVMAWVKPFAAFKRNVSVAYAWEPVIVKACRKPVVTGRVVMRDYIAESITMKRGLTGAKPEAVCRWAFEVMGAKPTDELDDLFPGSGAVARAWDVWRSQMQFEECSCDSAGPDSFGNYDQIEDPECVLHAAAPASSETQNGTESP
jgi:hypothetical protein